MHNIGLDRSRLTIPDPAENANIGADSDTEYRIDASLQPIRIFVKR